MITNLRILKGASPCWMIYPIIILTSIIISFVCIHSGYNKWKVGASLQKKDNYIHRIDNLDTKNKWHLSTTPLTQPGMPVSSAEKVDILPTITVSGIINSSDKLTSRAILLEGEDQNVYAINDVLKSAANTRITDITKNEVTLKSGAQTHRLSLLAELPSGAAAPEDAHHTAVLSDFIETKPVRGNNVLHGLRIFPRQQAERFTGSSLEPGDMAIRLNNISLTQQDNIIKAQEALRHLQIAQFTVLRNSSPRLINISVQQFQGKKED
ncbi:type II secretion system protein GspC [Klebsiella sp. RIT-PI-d]|uniref:type II secretion system protein GspC n=1 Tax=Klebsiella sp. RIT-PI-d TaxID=1681196 RepID=UPI0011E5276E|nr:type II secretion system protein GspC [Klebsiella sp. RIT-PI-d]